MNFFNKVGNPKVLEDYQINFSKDAIEGDKNLTTQVSTYTDIVSFNDAYFYLNENDPNSFFVKGTLEGHRKIKLFNKIVLLWLFMIPLVKKKKMDIILYVKLVNKNPDDFLVKCSPVII